MADFCWECTADTFGVDVADRNDLAFIGEPGGPTLCLTLCEGCGLHWFTTAGVRLHADNHTLFGCRECAENNPQQEGGQPK